ncbi:MAG: 5'/3'-nucleotidase SurE [Comamonadaceae bacterium]|nr:MAG: 5'/3'-nucleotidase SurE [Comamonadaceae bacterium]
MTSLRILICNDDGHHSPGLHALERAARAFSDDVWTVAPEIKRSSMGHSISLHESFTLTKLGERRYSCSGTPADCAIAGISWLCGEDSPLALVLSGVNDGRNIGEDIAYSGTMSIAREASFWKIPAIAFSAPNTADFKSAAMTDWLSKLVRRFAADTAAWHQPDTWLSINLPASVPAPLRHAAPGRAKIAPGVVVQGTQGDKTVLRYQKGRRSESLQGDEASQIDAGFATVYRLRWNGYAALDNGLLDGLNQLIAPAAQSPESIPS